MSFSDEQFERLQAKLLRYDYKIKSESPEVIPFNYRGGEHGIPAMLTKKYIGFSSDLSENGVFEISQTASEFADNGEYKKLDSQNGGWEDF